MYMYMYILHRSRWFYIPVSREESLQTDKTFKLSCKIKLQYICLFILVM